MKQSLPEVTLFLYRVDTILIKIKSFLIVQWACAACWLIKVQMSSVVGVLKTSTTHSHAESSWTQSEGKALLHDDREKNWIPELIS